MSLWLTCSQVWIEAMVSDLEFSSFASMAEGI